MARIVIEHLCKTFVGPKGEAIRALQDVSLSIEEQELMVLVGPSGCGKTTALRLVAGLEEPSSGAIFIDGKPMNGVAPGERDIAMVFQNAALYPHMTVRENIAFGLRVRKLGSAEVERRVGEAAEMLDLAGCLNRRPMELSGGQSQRVAIGRALVRHPKVILLDEPLSNLDARMRAQMRLELARLHRQLSATILYVTHDQVEALTLGHRVAVMRAGEVEQVSAPMELYHDPATLFVAEFIGAQPMNLVSGKVIVREGGLYFRPAAAEPDALIGPLALPNDPRFQAGPGGERNLTMGIRAEHVHLFPPDQASAEAQATPTAKLAHFGTAKLELVERTGADTYFHLGCGDLRLIARVGAGNQGRVGDSFSVAFDLGQARYFDPTTGKTILCGS